MKIMHEPPNHLQSIDEVWLFISVDETGEGVVAAPLGDQLVPLIAADEARLSSLRSLAKRVAGMTKKKIKLVKFSVREEIEEIVP